MLFLDNTAVFTFFSDLCVGPSVIGMYVHFLFCSVTYLIVWQIKLIKKRMVGLVTFEVSLCFMLKFKPFKN